MNITNEYENVPFDIEILKHKYYSDTVEIQTVCTKVLIWHKTLQSLGARKQRAV